MPVSTDLISYASSAELARMRVSSDDREQIGGNDCIFRLGSGTKIDKFQDLLMICILCVFIYFSTCRADDFRVKIEKDGINYRASPLP